MTGAGTSAARRSWRCFQEWMAVSPEGPLWFRGFSQWSDSEGTQPIEALVKAYGDVRFVVGHTVQTGGRIRSRFDGRVFLIDTGMLSTFFPAAGPRHSRSPNGRSQPSTPMSGPRFSTPTPASVDRKHENLLRQVE